MPNKTELAAATEAAGAAARSVRSPTASVATGTGDFDDASGKNIFDADKARDERIRRLAENLRRGTALHHGSVAQHDDPVGERHGVGVIVGDEDRRDRQRAQERQQLVAQLIAGLGIERRKRLVEQKQVRSAGERPRQRDALFLAGAQIGGARCARCATPK